MSRAYDVSALVNGRGLMCALDGSVVILEGMQDKLGYCEKSLYSFRYGRQT